MSVWYLMFDGSSADGRGEPDYVGRTLHKPLAKQHFESVIKSPYSIGKVMIVNDFVFRRATESDFN